MVLGEGRFLTLHSEAGWEFVRRNNASGVVVVVAISDKDEIVFVEQFRPPVNASVIELPAGLCGDTNDCESALTAAQRELQEETGYTSDQWRGLPTGPSSAGMSSEVLQLFVATGCRKSTAGGGVGDENITVHVVPIASAYEWLLARSRSGTLIDPKVFAGLYFCHVSD